MRGLAASVLAALLVTAPQDTAVFHGATHGVTVDVTVFDGRTIVSSLGAQDFEVADNGAPQAVVSVSPNRLPIDLRLIFDTSGSISAQELDMYRRAMRSVADALKPDDRCEIVGFTTRVTSVAPRQSPPITIDLQRMLPDGTAFFDAVSLGLITVPSLDRRQIVIVLSDAQDNASFFDEATLMDAAKRTDAVVYTVLPARIGSDEPHYVARLQALSLLTGGRLVQAAKDSEVGTTIIDAIEEFRSSYVVRYTLGGTVKPGWHALGVKVRGPHKYTVRARPGYFID